MGDPLTAEEDFGIRCESAAQPSRRKPSISTVRFGPESVYWRGLMRMRLPFLVLTGFSFNCTMLDMVSAAEGVSIRDTAYHAWVAVRRVLADQRCG